MRMFITGAGGRIGSRVAAHLQDAGHEVVATDVVYRPKLPFQLHLADLCDIHAVYPLVEGCEAVIHLGNHPHSFALRPAQKLLAQNTAMNANVYYAALDVGIRNVVGISSVQAVSGFHESEQRRFSQVRLCRFPYLPADENFPLHPGNNPYALSKAFSEQTLQAMCSEFADLSATAVRLPWVEHVSERADWFYRRPIKAVDGRAAEAFTYLGIDDVCTLLQAIVEQPRPGYRAYFPAQSLSIRGMTPAEVAATYLAHVPVNGPLDGEHGLVDLSALERDLGWSPAQPPLEVEQAEESSPATV